MEAEAERCQRRRAIRIAFVSLGAIAVAVGLCWLAFVLGGSP